MSDMEKEAAAELLENFNKVADAAKDYVSGYLKGRLDECKARAERDTDGR